MGAYTSIRGWIGLTDEMLPSVREVISRAPERAEQYSLTSYGAEFYNQGWVVPEEHINWTHYIFYGADIRTEAIPYLRDQLEEIARVRLEDEDGFVDYPDGVLYLDEDGTYGHPPRLWELRKGELHEHERSQ